MPYKTALDMSLYLDKENDYVPWKAATSALAYIGGRLSMTSNYGLYQVNISNCFFEQTSTSTQSLPCLSVLMLFW